MTLALLINSIIGLDWWWDNARETLSCTRIPLPGFGSVWKQNTLWDISRGAGVSEDLQNCITPTLFNGVFFEDEEEEISVVFPIGSTKVGGNGSGQVLPAVPPPPPPPPSSGPDNAHSVCLAPCEAITTFPLT